MGQGGRSSAARAESKAVTASQLNKRFGEGDKGYAKRVLSNADRALLTKAAGLGKSKVLRWLNRSWNLVFGVVSDRPRSSQQQKVQEGPERRALPPSRVPKLSTEHELGRQLRLRVRSS